MKSQNSKGTLKRYVTEMKFMRAIREEACIARAQAINLVLTFRKIDEYYTSQVFCVYTPAKTNALIRRTGPSLLDQIKFNPDVNYGSTTSYECRKLD